MIRTDTPKCPKCGSTRTMIDSWELSNGVKENIGVVCKCGHSWKEQHRLHSAPKKDRVRLEIEYGKDKKRIYLEHITLVEGTGHISLFNANQYIKIKIKEVMRDIE